MIVGLTGGIGSGKTTVARIFAVLGIPVYDADAAARRIMNGHPVIREKLTAYFGAEAYAKGELNRPFIAGIVFNQPEKLEWLNALVHPYTIADANEWAAVQNAAYTIKEAALMFESAAHHHTDFVVGVFAPQALRVQRVMQRDGLTREAVIQRMERQLSEQIKMKLCDFVIQNNEQEPLIPQVLQVHNTLLEKAGVPTIH